MDFYDNKKEAVITIDRLLKEGKTEAEITNVMQLKFGFGKLFVQRRILLLEELGSITIKDGKIKVH